MCSFLFTNIIDFDQDEVNHLIQKRGPDYTGIIFRDGYTYIHNLLSITGSFKPQPLECEGSIYLFNGEIYNYELFGNFESDAECIVELYRNGGTGRIKDLDGEYAIFIHDKSANKFLLATDVFGTKPLYYCIEEGKIGVCSYPDPLISLGFENPIRMHPNKLIEIDTETLKIVGETTIFEFNLEQKKPTYEDWKSAFIRSIQKRTKNLNHNLLLPLSSGYDSGLIACALNQLGVDYVSYSIRGSENNLVLDQRMSANINSSKEIINSIPQERISEIKGIFRSHVQHFFYGPNPLEITHDGFEDPGAVGLYHILDECKKKHEIKIVLSGQGADEIMSNIQTYGFRTRNPENFDLDLEKIFPWGNFYFGSQWSYLMKEECVAGSLGIETRYPFLDRDLVQEYLWLLPELKNREYKAPIASFLDDFSYPYHKQKIGFNIGQ